MINVLQVDLDLPSLLPVRVHEYVKLLLIELLLVLHRLLYLRQVLVLLVEAPGVPELADLVGSLDDAVRVGAQGLAVLLDLLELQLIVLVDSLFERLQLLLNLLLLHLLIN